MVLYLLVIAFQVFCIVDVIRRGRSTIWIMALVFLPLASGIAYFIVEILPGLQGNRHVRVARQKIVDKMDPERELRAAQQALDVADTMANRIRVAWAAYRGAPSVQTERGRAAGLSHRRETRSITLSQ
jgi:hypothetical protein